MKATIFNLAHGREVPDVYHYDGIETEEQFENMLAMSLMIGNEKGEFSDKIFGYWNGTWYHAVPSSDEKKYSAQEIEDMLTLPCCHTSGTHSPTHYRDSEYICNDQIAEAFESICLKLLINPKVEHSDNCGWCRDYPAYTKGDGKEFWDMPNKCVKCGMPPYYHEYEQSKCDGFEPTTFERVLELYGGVD